MRLSEALKFMIILACVVTVGQLLLISTIVTAIESEFFVYARYLYRYPLMSLASVMPTLIFVNSERVTKSSWRVRVIFHFFFTAIIVLASSIYQIFYWASVGIHLELIIVKILSFIIIYAGAWWAFDRRQQSLSDELNKRISELNED